MMKKINRIILQFAFFFSALAYPCHHKTLTQSQEKQISVGRFFQALFDERVSTIEAALSQTTNPINKNATFTIRGKKNGVLEQDQTVTPLIFAIKNRRIISLDILLSAGCDPNQQYEIIPESRKSAFSYALKHIPVGNRRRYIIVEKLLTSGADLNTRITSDQEELSVLSLLIKQHDVELIRTIAPRIIDPISHNVKSIPSKINEIKRTLDEEMEKVEDAFAPDWLSRPLINIPLYTPADNPCRVIYEMIHPKLENYIDEYNKLKVIEKFYILATHSNPLQEYSTEIITPITDLMKHVFGQLRAGHHHTIKGFRNDLQFDFNKQISYIARDKKRYTLPPLFYIIDRFQQKTTNNEPVASFRDTLNELLEHGANPNLLNSSWNNQTALTLACKLFMEGKDTKITNSQGIVLQELLRKSSYVNIVNAHKIVTAWSIQHPGIKNRIEDLIVQRMAINLSDYYNQQKRRAT